MKARNIVGILVAAPALVLALAGPGNAASTGAIAFAGTVKLVPQSTGSTTFCLFGAPGNACANGQPSTGIAAGAAMAGLDPANLDPTALQPAVVDGLEGSAAYTDSCVTVNGVSVPVTGIANITAKVHEVGTSAWRGPINAQWSRAGLVAVISGDATGAALFAPVGAALCGTSAEFAVVGAAEIRY
ncbi:MAG: hypothetical protein QOE45_2107 [Frankiaceae bacterium]|jgi:hypothetical protein|nr:hypothetical protein [Frankiaceae bacterium]